MASLFMSVLSPPVTQMDFVITGFLYNFVGIAFIFHKNVFHAKSHKKTKVDDNKSDQKCVFCVKGYPANEDLTVGSVVELFNLCNYLL